MTERTPLSKARALACSGDHASERPFDGDALLDGTTQPPEDIRVKLREPVACLGGQPASPVRTGA
jgi:hypothetical protein